MAKQKPGTHGHEGRKAVFQKSAGTPTQGICREKHEVFIDEPEWLRASEGDEHPSPVDYMMTALTSCQISVLAQCFAKSRVEEYDLEAEATISDAGEGDVADEMPEHTANRIRHVNIDIEVTVPEEYESQAQRCLDVYDSGCIVGQSFKNGIDYTPTTSLSITK